MGIKHIAGNMAKQAELRLRGMLSGTKGVEIIDLGLGAAEINDILRSTEKRFVAFKDKGAKYPKDYFDRVIEAMSLSGDIACARGLIKSHEGKSLSVCRRQPARYVKFDPSKDAGNCMMIPNGAVFRTDLIRDKDIYFDEDLVYTRDMVFTAKYHEASGTWVQLNKPVYKAGVMLDESSRDTPQSNENGWYTESTKPLLEHLKGADGSLSRIAQYILLYAAIHRFRANQNNEKMAFASPAEQDAYLSEVGEVLRSVEDRVMFSGKASVKMKPYYLSYIAGLRDQDYRSRLSVKPQAKDALLCYGEDAGCRICRLSELEIPVVKLSYAQEDGQPGIELHLKDVNVFPEDSWDLVFVNEGSGGEFTAKRTPEITGLTYFFNHEAARTTSFTARVTLDSNLQHQRIQMYADVQGHRYPLKMVFAENWQNKINSDTEFAYWYKEGFVFHMEGGGIAAEKADADDLDRYEERYMGELKRMLAAAKDKQLRTHLEKGIHWREIYFETLDQFEGRRIWTYYDKGYKAGDNGEYAIRYASTQYDGIEKYFYIDGECPDYERLVKDGINVVTPYSDESDLLAMHAEVIYMTHVPPYRKIGLPDQELKYIKDVLDAKVIRLYHGFPIIEHATYSQSSDDAAAVAIGTVFERDVYGSKDHGFGKAQIIESGMPRYDDLYDRGEKRILIAPTWRPSLTGKTIGYTGETLYNEHFTDSVYFREYNAISTNEKLLETARRRGYKIAIFMHPKLAAQTRDFASNDVVESLSCTKDIDYVTIMQSSSLMVTDFSSVQFDFAYMRKPVVYYHAPELPYWRPMTFDFAGMGFGEICTNVDEIVDVLCDYMERDCALRDEYRDRIDKFFIHSDHNAAARLYEQTLKLI